MYFENFNEPVYEILASLTGLKFKSQIKNSGIELSEIYEVKNLLNDKTHFVLKLDESVISFTTKKEFIVKFHNYVIDNLKKLDYEFEDLNENRGNYMHIGNGSYIYHRKDEISYHYEKQIKLVKKMKELINKIENK